MSENLPKITVITPSFNQGDYIEATIKSVLDQAYPNLEYMVFDGGSTDQSVSIIRRFADRITHWESGADRGQSHAINKGFERTGGEIVTWINSDDKLLPGSLQFVGEFFRDNPGISVLHGRTNLVGSVSRTVGHPEPFTENLYLGCLPFPQPSSFFRASAIQRFGPLSEDLHFAMDYDFFLKQFLHSEFARTQEVLSDYLFHSDSKSVKQNELFARDYALVFSKLLRSFPQASRFLEVYKTLGYYREGSDIYESEKSFSEADFEEAFNYHLKYLMSFYYEVPDAQNAHQISAWLVKYAPKFCTQHPEIIQIKRRSGILGSKGLKLMRKILR